MTLGPGAMLSSTIRRFSAAVHYGRSGPDRNATLLTFAFCLQINQQAIRREIIVWKAALTGGLFKRRATHH